MWRHITRGLRVLGNRRAADGEVADEVSHYLEEATKAQIARGLTPEAARRVALLELGNVTAVREEVRSYGWENAIDTFFGALRYAFRRLAQKPGFAAASLGTLALGIGATAAIFAVINGVLLKPLAFPRSEEIVELRHTAPGINLESLSMAASLYFTYSEERRAFTDVAAWQRDHLNVTGMDKPEEVPALVVTARFLHVLGVFPVLGRTFTPADDDPQGERTVILSDGYWRSRFGADRSVLGRSVSLNGNPHTVIGVMPSTFDFMDRPASLIVPMRRNRADTGLISFCCQGIARLKPGVSLATANADVARMLAIAPSKFPVGAGFSTNVWAATRIGPWLRPLKDTLVGDLGKTLWLLMATVTLVLLIACANVANLLLVRADGRQQELAVRAALGAGWRRIAGELLLESLLLGLAGGALGLGFAYGAVRMLAAADLPYLPRIHDISIDPAVLAFTFVISLAAALLFGLIPVFKYARPHLANTLRSGGRSLSESKDRGRARSLLVVVQVALAVILLVGSGLMIRTFQSLRKVDPGFSGSEHVETLRISIPDTQVPDTVRAVQMEEEILRKIEAVAGVSAVAFTDALPLGGGKTNNPIYAENQPVGEGDVPPLRRLMNVSPNYFRTIGSRFIAGRDFTWAETKQPRPVAIISENMARELWGDPQKAIGKRISPRLKETWQEIVGVVVDLHDDGIEQKPPAIVYWPLLQKFAGADIYGIRSGAYVIRTQRAGTTALLRELQQAVASVNPNLPVADVKTLESVYRRSLARTSFTLVLLAIAGGMALLLGVIGIYAVTSYSVSQRTREIGIRLALGATLQNVTAGFVRQGLVLSCIGAICGLAAAFALTRLMKTLLYDVSPADPLTYAGVSAGLILAAALASYLPARKATKVDPCDALRAE